MDIERQGVDIETSTLREQLEQILNAYHYSENGHNHGEPRDYELDEANED